jgi:hypothetical protein
MMKRLKLPIVIVIVIVALALSVMAAAVVAADTAKTITGKASCGGCTGVVNGCCLMLTDNDGVRWILRGDNQSLKAAFKSRHSGKTMAATLAGEPVAKKGADGKDYKEVKVSEVKIKS